MSRAAEVAQARAKEVEHAGVTQAETEAMAKEVLHSMNTDERGSEL